MRHYVIEREEITTLRSERFRHLTDKSATYYCQVIVCALWLLIDAPFYSRYLDKIEVATGIVLISHQ